MFEQTVIVNIFKVRERQSGLVGAVTIGNGGTY